MAVNPDPEVVYADLKASREYLAPTAGKSGICVLFARNRTCLPEIKLPADGLVYIGVLRDHFWVPHSGLHSPRRSLGAILKSQLGLTAIPRGSSLSPSNFNNFRFTEEGEQRLSRWMLENLQYAEFPFDGDRKKLKKQLIGIGKPPLCLTNWPNPKKAYIRALRKTCRDEAEARG